MQASNQSGFQKSHPDPQREKSGPTKRGNFVSLLQQYQKEIWGTRASSVIHKQIWKIYASVYIFTSITKIWMQQLYVSPTWAPRWYVFLFKCLLPRRYCFLDGAVHRHFNSLVLVDEDFSKVCERWESFVKFVEEAHLRFRTGNLLETQQFEIFMKFKRRKTQ